MLKRLLKTEEDFYKVLDEIYNFIPDDDICKAIYKDKEEVVFSSDDIANNSIANVNTVIYDTELDSDEFIINKKDKCEERFEKDIEKWKKEMDKFNKESVGFFLETAHPIKFMEVVEIILNTKLTIPKQILTILNKEKISSEIKTYDDFKNTLI
jgi:hypothetical protein